MPHPQQQFQYGCGQYGQYTPMRYFMMHPPPPIPVWQHQYYPHQPNQHFIPPKFELPNHHHQQQQQNDNWSSQETRCLLDTQNEFIKGLTNEKNDLKGQLKELWENLQTTENDEREANLKLEKKTAELDELLVRIENEKGQKVNKATETDSIELVERPPTLPSPELDPIADELVRLKNELSNKNKLLKKMEAEMERAKENLGRLMDAQNVNKKIAKKKESLENCEEIMKVREKRFIEEKEFAIARCRSKVDGRIAQMQLKILAKNTALEYKDKKITKLKGLNRKILKELDDSKSSRNRLLRDLNNLESIKEKLLEEICIEKEKLKKQANRCEQMNLELAAKNGEITQKEEELKARNEEMKKMKEKHKIAMDSTLDAYKTALGENDERTQKLREEIVEKEEQWKAKEEENWQLLMMAENEQGRLKQFQQEIAKMKSENEEIGDRESKVLANAKKYELKLAEKKEEIGKIKSELAKMEILVRTVEKESEDKQKKLDKIEAEMKENKKEELILRIKREMEKPPKSTFDEIIQTMDKTTTTKRQQVKKVGGGIRRGKKQQRQCSNELDYVPQGAKKRRMAAQPNANPTQPIVNSISNCTPSTSSNLQPSKKPIKLQKSVGDEALMKIGTPAYCLRQRGRTIGASPTKQQRSTAIGGRGQLREQGGFDLDLMQHMATRCEHLFSKDCEKCKQRYKI